jgi:hypothetical protein
MLTSHRKKIILKVHIDTEIIVYYSYVIHFTLLYLKSSKVNFDSFFIGGLPQWVRQGFEQEIYLSRRSAIEIEGYFESFVVQKSRNYVM